MSDVPPSPPERLFPKDAVAGQRSAVPVTGEDENVAFEAVLRVEPASADEDLRTSLAALSQLAAGLMRLKDVLLQVVGFAVLAIPGADGGGFTLLADGHPDSIAASAPFVAEVDAIQCGIAEGPGMTAVVQARPIRSGEIGTDPQWPRFGTLVEHLGVHSALSIPLLSPAGVLGAMNVYAHQRDAFDGNGVLIGELFAVPAAIAVQNAHLLAQTNRLATRLQGEWTGQATIDRASGILMSRLGCTPDQAIDQLSQISHTENATVHAIASRVVEGARQLARAGRANPWLSVERTGSGQDTDRGEGDSA